MDIRTLLEESSRRFADKPAIIFADQPITYRQLRDSSFTFVHNLLDLGIQRGDKVAVFLPNRPEYIYSYLAVFSLRGVCVPLDFMLTEEELISFINHSESKLLIATQKRGVNVENIKNRCPLLKEIILVEENIQRNFQEQESLDKRGLLEIDIHDSDFSSIFYTSGSTGHPKGVLLTYGHLDNPVEVMKYFLQPADRDSFICAGVPFSHVGGLDYMLFMLYFGSTLVLMERFQPLEFLKNIEKYRTTIFCIVPSMYVAVLSLKEYDKFDLSSLRYAVVFGAPSSPALLERFHKVCPNAYLLNGWGMTETAAPNSFLPTGTQAKEVRDTGKFLPGTEAKIVDDKGESLVDEQEGELWIRGKAVMACYYKEPDLTAEVLTEYGWLKTGDIAKRDSQGRYYIVGRKKEMIKVAGEVVFEPEVESAIHRHPAVAEVAVIGVPDKLRGEVPRAFVVLKDGASLAEEELRYFCRQHLAHFKIPHYFEFRDSLPKNRLGKIDKETLRKL